MIKNQINLIGNVGVTPELKVLDSGKKVTRFTLATNETYKDSEGVKQDSTEWHSIVGWGKTAELMCDLLQKGDYVAVTGKLTYRSWEDSEGIKRRTSEIILSEFLKLNSKEKDD